MAADRVAWARLLRAAHEVALSGRGTPGVVRAVVARSWRRCQEAHVDPDRPAPIAFDADDVAARLAAHPLAAVVPAVHDLASPVSAHARHLAALSDADGVLLWAEGHPSMREAAIGPRFVTGAVVGETAMGTNAVGTALALDHAIQIFSAEHFNRLLHGWSSAAAPIHDRASGAVLGTVSLSGSFRTAHPHTLPLIEAIARAAEGVLAAQQQRREADLAARYVERLPAAGRRPSALIAGDGRVLSAAPRGWLGRRVSLPANEDSAVLADGTRVLIEPLGDGPRLLWGVPDHARAVPRPALYVGALAPSPPVVVLDGRRLALSARHVELLVVLALAPGGLSANALAEGLYGSSAKAVTVRAELARLRRHVGGLVLAQPYRLAADVFGDFIEVDQLLRRGALLAAARRYTGALLPHSGAPAIVAARARLADALRDTPTAGGPRRLARDVVPRHLPGGPPHRPLANATRARAEAAERRRSGAPV